MYANFTVNMATVATEPKSWGWACPECDEHRDGMTQAHATNSMNKHNREKHPQPDVYVGRVAALVLAAAEDLHEARGEATDPDKAWVLGKAGARMAEVMAFWRTLMGLPLSESDGKALDLATRMSREDVVAHVAPF